MATLAVGAIVASSAALAQAPMVDLPAGTVGQQVSALGRLADASIVVPDARLWNRRVPALRGRLSLRAALDLIARRARAEVEPLGRRGWRLRPAILDPRPVLPRARSPARPRPAIAETGEDIVVIASKRDTTRDNFPGQVSRVRGSDLDRVGAGGTDRLVQRLTSVTSTYLGAGRNKLFIRGIADSSFTGPTQATVGQYYGDLRLSYNAPDPDLRLADLAAVEVLEGPQGTLYGAGSLGGLIRLVPNKVDLDRIDGSLTTGGSATSHGEPGLDTQTVLNVPLAAGRAALRFVATSAIEGGYIDKPALGRVDVNTTRILSGRTTAHVAIDDDWNVELIGIGQRIRGADSQYADRNGDPLSRSAPVAEGFAADYGQLQTVLSGRVGEVSVRSSTGVTAHDLLERYDATAPGGPVRLFSQENRTRMQANETRLWRSAPDGSGWLAGVSFIHNRSRLRRLFGPPGSLTSTTGVTNGITEWTGYGEGSLRMLPRMLVTLGMRATRSVLDGRGEEVSALVAAARGSGAARRIQTIALPAAAMLYDVTDGTKLFLRYQQGFRPGGLAIESDFVRQFRNDRVATVEMGGRLKSDSVDATLSVARASWRDIQADFVDGTGLPSTANIGNGVLWTVEATASVRPARGLRLESAISYNDGRIEEPSIALLSLSSRDPADARADVLARLQQIPNISRVTTRAGVSFARSLGHMDFSIDAWARYVGSSRLGVGPVLGQRQGDYFDSELSARFDLGRVGVTASVTNLTDERGNRFALGTPFTTGRDQITPLRPRTFRIGIDTRF